MWDRLERYGSAEAIESSLFKVLDRFPKIPNKAYQKLRELNHLLMELQVAKAEGDLQGFAFLDTARGFNPIVQKLPYNLQEQLITHGSKYKRHYNVPFPSFSVVDFLSQQAKTRNFPNFDFTLCAAPTGLNSCKPPRAVHKLM